jgi:hypothetical protein
MNAFNRIVGRILAVFAAALVGLMFSTTPASAVGNCVAEASGLAANQKGCTSQDVEIAGVTSICVSDGQGGCQSPPHCIDGQSVTFTANFSVREQTNTTGGNQTRYDIGLYFANDGDPDGTGAFRGSCSVNAIGTGAGAGFVDLDSDTCGDIDPTHNPLSVPLTITTVCTGVPDPDNPGKKILKLPACTTWKVPGGNTVCSANADGSNPTTAIASSSSKCKCQPGFTIPIFVETPTITTTKSANPATLEEQSTQNVTFSVTVKNNGSITVHLAKLTDDIYGNIADASNPAIVSTTCLQAAGEPPHDIAAGGTYSCSFVAPVSVGDYPDEETDTVCASGTDTQGGTVGGDTQTDPPSSFCASATVVASDVASSATLDKTVTSADVTYQVVVTNTSAKDALTLTKLCDDRFGDISSGATSSPACPAKTGTGVLVPGTTTCPSLPTSIAVGGHVTCTFVGRITSSNTDTVKGTLNDNDGNTLEPSDSATVTITN